MYQHILVALDGTPKSEQALKQAIALARLTNAKLSGLSVIERLPAAAASVGEVEEVLQATEEFFQQVQQKAANSATLAGVKMECILRKGNAAQAILRYARENSVDLIVIGAEMQKGLGNTADKVSENASCSVLIARIDLPSIRVKDTMTTGVVTVPPTQPLADVVRLMVEQGLKAMPVVADGKVVGIITGGDLLNRAGMQLRLSIQRILPEHLLSQQIQRLSDAGKTAQDIMTSPVICISDMETVARAAEIMHEKRIKRLPVVDQNGALVGIISRMDILAVAASTGLSNGVFPSISHKTPKTAGDIMLQDVPTIAPEATLQEVVNKLVATPLRRVVVVNERRRVLGIIVDTNLFKTARTKKTGALQNLLPHFLYKPDQLIRLEGQASDVMDTKVFSVQVDTPLSEVIQLMIDQHIKRLVVVDEENRLMGMVSRESILRFLIS